MHLRRIASFVLGAWIIGSLFMGYIAFQNASSADKLLSSPRPDLNKMVQTIGFDKVHQLFQYQGAEQNRHYLDVWERTQLALGPVLILLLVFATRVNRLAIALAGSMIIFAAFAHFVLTPEISYVGRGFDFAAGSTGGNRRLWTLEATYTALESLKLGMGCVLAGYLFVFKTKGGRPGTVDPSPVEDAEVVRG